MPVVVETFTALGRCGEEAYSSPLKRSATKGSSTRWWLSAGTLLSEDL
jgi:hypothetical protein